MGGRESVWGPHRARVLKGRPLSACLSSVPRKQRLTQKACVEIAILGCVSQGNKVKGKGKWGWERKNSTQWFIPELATASRGGALVTRACWTSPRDTGSPRLLEQSPAGAEGKRFNHLFLLNLSGPRFAPGAFTSLHFWVL